VRPARGCVARPRRPRRQRQPRAPRGRGNRRDRQRTVSPRAPRRRRRSTSATSGSRSVNARSALDTGQWFPPELALGPGELDSDTKERLSARIVAIATTRGVPLHVSVAWNALHFDYDPDRGSYADVFLEGTLPEVPLGMTTHALPVGALCWVQLGGKEVWAEVVGKDGRPGTIDDGFVDAAVSGAPAVTDDNGVVVLREALVVDLNAF